MAASNMSMGVVAVIALIYAVVMPMARAGFPSPAPSPAPGSTSDGAILDQAVAYILMFVALVLTYLIH
ncbi:hypothetical protein FNV43_RR23978 [Rhamnella rubrinervis]|uniref:Arabinogalactan protein n=1 Tax=Rhamnella rubrinervis TaxID=2594499 RepID=A0A8K0DLZ0_9ROSA|nr:hypothetical protein FNV43_RR23978 [Rhamnella rubrinervis]